MTSVKLSVIVPCYGVEQYLDRCLDSIVNQTIKDIEIILVDDGSPDRVPQMCEEWKKKDNRVVVIHKKNEGLGLARNSGLEIARGEYVAFVDSDDYVDFCMYETLFKEAIASNADAVYCGFSIEHADGRKEKSSEVSEKTVFANGEKNIEFMLDMIASAPNEKTERRYWMSVWHAIYRRNIIEKFCIRFPSERIVVSEDIPFQCEFLQNTSKMVYLPDTLYYYCFNNLSLTKTFKIEKFYRFKELHRVLSEITQKVPGSLLRIDRLYIGYVRSLIIQMFEMNVQERDKYLKLIINDAIWNDLKKRYSPSYLPLYPRMFYSLVLHNQKRILCYFVKGIILLKKITKSI